MRFKNTFLITMAVVLGITAFSVPASANVSASEDTAAAISVNDSVESKTPLTPKGNLTTVDDVHQVSDEDTIEDKQFNLNSQNALKELTETFSLERIAVITAVSIREQDHDGRISAQNKEWAKSVPFPKDIDDWGRDRNAAFRISAVHPGLLDLFANAVRKEIDLSKNFSLKKPSLVEKLRRPLPQKTDTAVKSKDKEL